MIKPFFITSSNRSPSNRTTVFYLHMHTAHCNFCIIRSEGLIVLMGHRITNLNKEIFILKIMELADCHQKYSTK